MMPSEYIHGTFSATDETGATPATFSQAALSERAPIFYGFSIYGIIVL
jgi:hypothetical protein